MKQKILISTSSYNISNFSLLNELEKQGITVVLNPYERRLTEEEATELLRDNVIGCIAGVEPLGCKVLKAATSLKVISRCGVGVDNVDLEAARELGILVYNTSNGPTEAVGELAVGLMLAVLRNIPMADRAIRNNNWKPVMGNLLGAKVIGIIGCGRIGKLTAHILANGFGCHVLGYDSNLSEKEWNDMPVMRIPTMQELLLQSDIVSLHIPGRNGNKYLIGKNEFGLMKNDAILINTARGGLVDETALLETLDQGKLAGAGLDVFEEEPYTGPLTKYENVVMTMHMGSYTRETRIKMEREAATNLIRGLSEKGVII